MAKPYTPDDRSESRWVPKPAKTHRAIAIDLPGYGLSIKGLAEIARKLPTLQAPLRLIYGEIARILPDIAKTMQRIQHDRPGTELTALSGCGHFLQEDEPERVGELIAEFFNRS